MRWMRNGMSLTRPACNCEKAVEQGTNTKGYRDVGGHGPTIGEPSRNHGAAMRATPTT